MSTRGRQRFQNHKILKGYRVRKSDEAHVWICKDGAQCLELERKLIAEHEPILNKLCNPRYAKTEYKEVKLRQTKTVKTKKIVNIPVEELTQCRSNAEYKELVRKYST